jgi:hypothetical protein
MREIYQSDAQCPMSNVASALSAVWLWVLDFVPSKMLVTRNGPTDICFLRETLTYLQIA